jgi:hypothetical protein
MEPLVNHIGTATLNRSPRDLRAAERRSLTLPARLTWKDGHGATRFVSVVTRNVSDFGVFVECQAAVSIPLYRLVQFQLERDVRDGDPVPASLRSGRILSAVYRVTSATPSGGRQGLALRLMVDPKRRAIEVGDLHAATA